MTYILQGSEYVSSFEYISVTHGLSSYSSSSQYARVGIYKGCEYVKVTQGSVQTVF